MVVKKNSQVDLKSWIADNIVAIVFYTVTIVLALGYLKAEVRANAQDISEIKGDFGNYPSADYFEEKFRHTNENIESNSRAIEDLEKKVDALVRDVASK